MPAAKTLSVAQLLVLNTAADRPDQMVLPLPTQIHARGAAMKRLLASLLNANLAEEVPTEVEAISWRRDDTGQRHALRVTALGRAAVGKEAATLAAKPVELALEALSPDVSRHPDVEAAPEPEQAVAPVTTLADLTPAPERAGVTPATNPDQPGGKLGQVLVAVAGDTGATLEELVILTGWQPHTARAALSRLRQRGFDLRLTTNGDRKAYRPWTGA